MMMVKLVNLLIIEAEELRFRGDLISTLRVFCERSFGSLCASLPFDALSCLDDDT